MQAVLDGTPSSVGAGGSPEQRRRHSSPFLARDCSSVDVFCPDRYSLWTRGGGLQKGAAAAGTAGSSTRLQQQLRRQQHRFAQSLEAAERGSTPSSSGGSDEAGGGGNGGLRGAFSSALRDALTWMSGRLRSHPIELSPSERASYGSCSSTRESSPLQLEPAGGSRDSPSDSRFVTPGSAGSASSTSSGCSGGLLAVAAGTAAQAGLPRRHLRYSSTEEEEAAAGRGCGSSCGSQGSVSLGAAGAAPASAGSSGRSSRCSDGGAGAAEDHGHLLASSSPSSQRPAEPALPSSPFDQPASSSGSGTGAAAQEADSAAGVAAEDSSADYQTPRCCSPEVSAEAAAYLACGTA